VKTVNIYEAKTHLSKPVEEVASRGEPFIIARSGKPLVRVAPLDQPRSKRRVGFLKGRYRAPDDIKEIGREEIGAMFHGAGGLERAGVEAT
jgi:antitoxin (DNA-binding transcriptional repressor) of toxin-antitoxin stability system